MHPRIRSVYCDYDFLFSHFRFSNHEKAIDKDGELREFSHPFVQAWVMFAGEIMCLVVFKMLYCWFSNREVS